MSDQQTVVNVNLTAPMATGVLPVAPKSTGAAFVFWFFLGTFGAHRFYLNRPHAKTMLILNLVGWATVLLFVGFAVLAAVGIWAMVDVFALQKWVATHNAGAASIVGVSPVPIETKPVQQPQDLSTQLLSEAKQRGGRLSVTQGVMATGKTFEDVEECLQGMLASGYVDVDNDPDSGVVVYVFGEMGR